MVPGVGVTKKSILKKVVGIFAGLCEVYREALAVAGDAVVAGAAGSPKIARGENYQGLPYVMLDYPRIFEKENILAIRSFFWWGHFFSISLLLSGKWKTKLEEELMANLDLGNWQIDLSENPWQHDTQAGNSLRQTDLTTIRNHPFLKLTAHLPLEKWEEAPAFFRKNFSKILRAFKKNLEQ